MAKPVANPKVSEFGGAVVDRFDHSLVAVQPHLCWVLVAVCQKNLDEFRPAVVAEPIPLELREKVSWFHLLTEIGDAFATAVGNPVVTDEFERAVVVFESPAAAPPVVSVAFVMVAEDAGNLVAGGVGSLAVEVAQTRVEVVRLHRAAHLKAEQVARAVDLQKVVAVGFRHGIARSRQSLARLKCLPALPTIARELPCLCSLAATRFHQHWERLNRQ